MAEKKWQKIWVCCSNFTIKFSKEFPDSKVLARSKNRKISSSRKFWPETDRTKKKYHNTGWFLLLLLSVFLLLFDQSQRHQKWIERLSSEHNKNCLKFFRYDENFFLKKYVRGWKKSNFNCSVFRQKNRFVESCKVDQTSISSVFDVSPSIDYFTILMVMRNI